MIRGLCIAWIAAMSCIGLTQPEWLYCYSSWWWLAFAFALMASLWLWYKDDIQQYAVWSVISKGVACIALFAIAWSYADTQLKQRLAQDIQTRQTIEGVVYIPKISEGKLDSWRQYAELLVPNKDQTTKLLLYPKRIYNENNEVVGLSTEALQLGHYYQVSLDIRPPHGYINEGVFDQEKWLLQQGIQGTATVLYSKEMTTQQIQQRGWSNVVLNQNTPLAHWRLWIEKLRLDYRQQLVGDQPIDQNRALLLGLLTGDRSAINQHTIQLYQVMGISHLLAISGPHVLILAAICTWLMMQCLHVLMRRGIWSRLYQYIPKPYVYLPVFIFCVSFYVVFTGFEIPAIRTWIIAVFCSIALLLRINISPLTTLLLAACAVLWWDCFAILSAEFWLSFGASAVLLFIYQKIQQHPHEQKASWLGRMWQFFKILWQSQWRIFLALIPIMLWQFQAISFIAPIINLIAIPVLTLLVVPLDIVAALVWQILPGLGELLWSLAAFILMLFNTGLSQLKPIATWMYLPSYLDGWALLSLTIAIVIISLPRGLIPRFWALGFLIPLLLPQQRPALQLDVLDVGQGQAIVLRTEKHKMLIDTGAGGWQDGQSSMGDRVVVPFLRHQGIRSLDEVLLSHLDNDHSGGAPAVISQIKVKQLRSNAFDTLLTNYPHVPFIPCLQGQSWQWDGVKVEILSPRAKQTWGDENESSCVVKISTKMQGQALNILVMGDVGWEGEYYLLRDYPNLTADILVLGHHGSRYSSAYEFLDRINPRLAIISAGFANRYGHPSPVTLMRLKSLNIPYANTADLGAIHVQLENSTSMWSWQYERSKKQWLLPWRAGFGLNTTDQ